MLKKEEQVLYNNMWIDRNLFRAFVYKGDEKRLADTYEEFLDLISQGYTEHPDGMPVRESNLFEHEVGLQELPLYEDNHEYAIETNEPVEPVEPVKRGRKRKQIDILS